MVTSNALYLTILCCLGSIQGLEEIFRNITASSQGLSRLIDGAAVKNNSKSQEFAPILNYFVKLNLIEKRVKKELVRLTEISLTEDNSEKIYGSLDWQNAINDALQEENITAGLNKRIDESVDKYIDHLSSTPKELKERYQHTLLNTRRYEQQHVINNSSEASIEKSKDENEFWEMPSVTDTRRIYGGDRTKIKFFPFMASVLIFNRFSCAGSIISKDLVVTAASCLQLAWNNRFFRENPAFLSVRVGSHFFSVGGELIPVLEVFFHPTYVPRTLVNNIAVMRLERNLRFGHRRVKKIDFDRNPSALPVNTPGITIVGWGAKTRANKIYNGLVNRIHLAVLDFYDLQSCREIYGKNFVTRTNFCAGFITTGAGACNLDVGDPGITGRLLVGVVSFGSPVCGRKDTPTVFTKIGYYADWIESIMEQNVPRGRVRTTTWKPFTWHKEIKLYGLEEDLGPIPPLRGGVNPETKFKEPTVEPGIPPIVGTDPKYEYDDLETSKQIQRERPESEKDKLPEERPESEKDKAPGETPEKDKDSVISAFMDEMGKESSISKDDDSDDSMNAKNRVTKAMEPDLKGSHEAEESDLDWSLLDSAILSDAKMTTDMGIVDPEDDKLDASTKTDREPKVESELESETDEALRKKHDTITVDGDNKDDDKDDGKDDDKSHEETKTSHSSKKKHKKTKRKKKSERMMKKHTTTPSDDKVSVNSAESIGFGYDNQEKKDSLESDYKIASETSDIQRHDNHTPDPQHGNHVRDPQHDNPQPDPKLDNSQPDPKLDNPQPDHQYNNPQPDRQYDNSQPDHQYDNPQPDRQHHNSQPDLQHDKHIRDPEHDNSQPDRQYDNSQPDRQHDSYQSDRQHESSQSDRQHESSQSDHQHDNPQPDRHDDNRQPDRQHDNSQPHLLHDKHLRDPEHDNTQPYGQYDNLQPNRPHDNSQPRLQHDKHLRDPENDSSQPNPRIDNPQPDPQDENSQPDTQPEITEELIKREIENLLSQLDFSSEGSSVNKNLKVTHNSQNKNAENSNGSDKNNTDDSVWTLLYVSDIEKDENKVKYRASQENSEQGLDIDPEPFIHGQRSNTESNKTSDLMGNNSDIYQIFAEVMKAVVNETAH